MIKKMMIFIMVLLFVTFLSGIILPAIISTNVLPLSLIILIMGLIVGLIFMIGCYIGKKIKVMNE